MKKFVKWFVFWVLVCGGIALASCYIAMPERTKLSMDTVVNYLNTPLGIAGGSTITLGFVIVVVAKYLIGRYRESVSQDIKELKSYADSKKEEAKEYYEKALQQKEEAKVILSYYQTQIDELTDKLVMICETTPNAKVKALGEQIKNGSKELKKQLNQELTKVENQFAEVIESGSKFDELNDKVKELSEKLERLVETYGEHTTND